jgi:hypothetical protein
MASRFALKRYRDVVPFLRASMRLRKEAAAAAGNVGVGLAANPFTKTFWTLSTWQSNDALRAYVAARAHRSTATRFRGASAAADFVFWDIDSPATAPTWAEAASRLAERSAR